MTAGLTRRSPATKRAPEILRRLREAYPASTVALEASNPLEMLIATILSAQCTDARVNQVTKTLFTKYRRAEDYLAVPEEELREDIRSTGFFNQKAKSVRGTCRRLVEVYGGEVPDTMDDLLTLPGVARKTANVVLGNSFGKVEGIAVDTHVRRLSQRFGFSTTADPTQIERDLMALLPKADWFDATYRLVDHGRLTCTARSPKCDACPVEDLCPASQA
ncbi:MAG: endonuclease III [Actinomycetota bacterium]